MPDITEKPGESVQEQLRGIHASLRESLPKIGRIAVARYDPRTDMLKTFVHSTEERSPFRHYERRLSEVASLMELAKSGKSRVVDDISAQPGLIQLGEHDRKLADSGYRSSYTEPFFDRDSLFGFLFFDSSEPHYFNETVVHHLSVYTRLISLLIINEVMRANMLRSAVDLAQGISHVHNEETGSHLERMARYSRLIAKTLANRDPADVIDDEFVEFVFLFAPMHDIGKVGIPDKVLLKPDKLSVEEFAVMKTHVSKGMAIVDNIAERFGIGAGEHIDILRNIVRYHHESFDGTGYLGGLQGDQIPLEARIVAVADVFDALTTERCYKKAWSNERAFGFLKDLAGVKFDGACVEALIANEGEVEKIKQRFADNNGFHEAYMEEV